MSIREVPTPLPGPGEVLIQVAASGVNFIDLYVREGHYANPVPFIPGQEASGTLENMTSQCSHHASQHSRSLPYL